MTPFEWLALLDFAVIATAGLRYARPIGWTYLAGASLLVIVARFTAPWAVRAWLPHAYLVFGYWIPAAFTPPGVNERFEAWLVRTDQRVGITSGRSHMLELAYLLCYPMVPAAFIVVFTFGGDADVERFWIAVLLAGYSCYSTLPWLVARPPRAIAAGVRAGSVVARINARVLGTVSHNLTTFPSGHVAVSFAAALATWPVSAGWALMFSALAIAIAAAAVVGRYHFAVDVAAGLAVGALAWVVAWATAGSL